MGPLERWAREAVRLHGRYEREIVERYGLCPWASRARRRGRICECVLLHRELVSAPSLAAIDSLEDGVDLALLLCPRMVGVGVDTIACTFSDILRDRDLTYRRSNEELS
jgi:hypothetical protein